MAFWWASQGKNYPIAIEQGSLWTCPRRNDVIPLDRSLIKEIRRGDTVFHYDGPCLRAVSVVVAEWTDCRRPAGYEAVGEGHHEDGWLVRVQPVITGLEIHWHRLRELINHGSPGPLYKNGRPQQKYLSSIDFATGRKLLDEIDIDLPESETATIPPAEDDIEPGVTDVASVGTARVEQRALRAFLLGTEPEAQCGLCGRVLPAHLLVAGHIKPRANCTEAERWDFAGVAMLVCALGCDALFERGYITVDGDGCVQSGRVVSSRQVNDAVSSLAGKKAAAHNATRAAAFEWHRVKSVST